MTNRDLLKEAIADAKAVKEVAITNAKAALEEAFTPHLKEMFEKKMMNMEEEEELKTEATDAEFDEKELEELLKELEEGEDLLNDPKGPTAHGNIAEEEEGEEEEEETEEEPEEEEGEEEEEEEVEIDLEDMTEEDLKKFIEEVVDEMIEAGELEAGHEGMEDEAGMEAPEMGADEMPAEEEAPMMEGFESIQEMDMSVDIVDAIVATLGTLGGIVGAGFAKASHDEKKAAAKKIAQAAMKAEKGDLEESSEEMEKMAEMEAELTEAMKTIKTLKSEVNEINLLNSKLLYTNKIFKAKNLSEAQKVKVLTSFDKAESVKEVKLVFETLNEGLEKGAKKELVRESKGYASKPVGTSPKQPVVDVNPIFERMKKLAGL
jgi:hypothetical protein